MKNPNGYGTIKKLSGNRRRPFVFVVTENGKQKVKGYFPTKLEALAFQVDLVLHVSTLFILQKLTKTSSYCRYHIPNSKRKKKLNKS